MIYFGTAKTAGDKYKTAYEEESNMSQIEINGKKYDSIEDYLAGVESIPEIHNWVRTGDNIKCEHCNTSLTIGQKLNYTNHTKTGAGVSTIAGDKSGVSNGITDGNLNAEDFGAKGTQTIHSDSDTKWIVLGVEDSNKNGTNETLLLTTQTPTTGKITMYGYQPYNHAVEEINRMCKEIYGTDARGMTIEDVNKVLGYTPAGGMYYLSSWITTGNLTTKLKDLGVCWNEITMKKVKFHDPSNPQGIKDNGKVLGEYPLDGYLYHLSADGTYLVNDANASDTSHKITTATKNLIFGDSKNYLYWLASRGVHANTSFARFSPGSVDKGVASSCIGELLFNSNGNSFGKNFSLRAVVSLRSDIPAVVADSGSGEL